MNDSRSEVSKEDLQRIFHDALTEEQGLTVLKGFKLDLSANKGFHKLFAAARCDCGTSALLSIEVDRKKTLDEVKEAMPGLLAHLRTR